MQGPVFASHRNARGAGLPDLLRSPSDDSKPADPTSAEPSDHIALAALPARSTSGSGHERRKQDETEPFRRAADPEMGQPARGDPSSDDDPPRRTNPIWRTLRALKRHLAFVGPGIIASVAYLDPGNYVTDLAAGSQFGYSHLFVVLFAGLMALLFQILSTRLGCVSDYDLATHCRFALYDRPGPFKLWYRWGLLYPLYLLSEAAIVMTDIAELLGSAIAINLLIPAIPLWASVLLTSLDVFLILLVFNQYPTRTMTTSMRVFEILIGLLVLVVLGSFVGLLIKVGPNWGQAFLGFVPSSGIINNGAIYIAVGIVGATVMPHAFYIGSKMATMRRLAPEQYGEEPDPDEYDSDGYESDDDDLKKQKREAEEDDEAGEPRAGRSRTRSASAVSRDPPPEGVRPYIPFLHLPQPMRLPNVGFDLSKLTRARTDSRERSVGSARPSGGRRRRRASSAQVGTSPSRSAPVDDIVRLSGSPEGQEGATDEAGDDVTITAPRRPRRPSGRRPGPSLACVRAHLTHACLDVAGSLLGFALVVNSAILILGAAVFYYGRTTTAVQVSDLFDAYDLIKQYLGQALAYVFAIALLMAGQSASLTVTLSGQIVSEGMIRWRTKPWKRRLVTRCVGIVPSLAVAVSVGRSGIDALLVGSQVALSIALTFVLIPLIIFTSQHSVMSVPVDKRAAQRRDEAFPPPQAEEADPAVEGSAAANGLSGRFLGATVRSAAGAVRNTSWRRALKTLNPVRRRSAPPAGWISYANSVPVIYLCWGLWWLIGIANVYALYQVAHPTP